MTVRVPFQLRRRPTSRPAPASALFLSGRDAATLLSACSRLGLDPSGCVYDLAGGFLLKLDGQTVEPVPGATRLREPSADLFVPADAELVPALLDDEAAGLVRDGGLVLLPGGLVLRFDRTSPVKLSALLTAAPGPAREWRPMPEPRALADRIVEVSREWPEPPPDELYQEWEQDVRRPRPSRRRRQPTEDQAGTAADAGDEAAEVADTEKTGGSGARGLMPDLRAMREALRNLFGRAASGAKSIGEKLRWGTLDHSALVQKLLREFRQGDTNQALRHAFSMIPADPRGRSVRWGNRLPFNRAMYNLIDLLGRPSRGGAVGIWQARSDLMDELRREYRKAAEKAIRHGDFRRAAYIYGKLLGDDRLAAQTLQRGGLHHDAAILYLKKLNDPAAAAQAFEAGGMVDRAIALYRQLGRHETAGDLLRRIGDDTGAKEAYLDAAALALDRTPPDWLEVGRILYHKAGLLESAVEAYRKGWDQRPAANATACALQLIAIHAPCGEMSPLWELLDEADAFFRSSGPLSEAGSFFRSLGTLSDAEAFYNRMATAVASVPALSPFAADVHDRARVALADQLRFQVAAGRPTAPAVSSLFGVPSLWAPPFVRDAQFASSAAAERWRGQVVEVDREPHARAIQVGRGTVTAACHASATAEVFLGFMDGKIFGYQPRENRVVPVGAVPGAVAEVVAGPDGQIVVVRQCTEHGAVLTAFLRRPDGSFRARPESHFSRTSRTWLTPILHAEPQSFIGLGDGRDLVIIEATAGLPMAYLTLARAPVQDHEPRATALLLPHGESFRVLTHDGPRWVLLDVEGQELGRSETAWRPAGSTVPLSWTYLDGLLKIVGLDAHGAVHASQLWIEESVVELLSSPVATTQGGYLAVAQIGPSKVVAVSASRIDWLSDGFDHFHTVCSLTERDLTHTVACFPTVSPQQVLVVSAHGLVSRIDAPRPRKSRKGMA